MSKKNKKHYDFLSDSSRLSKVVVLLAIVIGLSFYSYAKAPEYEIEISEIVETPDIFDGKQVVFGRMEVVDQNEQSIVIQQYGKRVAVLKHPNQPQLHTGDLVLVKGIFYQEGFIDPEFVKKEAAGKYGKYISSIPVVILLGYLFMRSYRFEPKQFVFVARKEKRNA